MTNQKPFNVDICVTCIADKAPKLPLREELPSLGIEVIYNAQGVGEEAVEKQLEKQKQKQQMQIKKEKKKKQQMVKDNNKNKQQTKSNKEKKVTNDTVQPEKQQQQQQQQQQSPTKERGRDRNRRSSPPGRTAFSPIKAKKEDPPEDISIMDDYLTNIPKALTYSKYQRTLELRNNNHNNTTTNHNNNNNNNTHRITTTKADDNPSVSSSLETSPSMDENQQKHSNILSNNNKNKNKNKNKNGGTTSTTKKKDQIGKLSKLFGVTKKKKKQKGDTTTATELPPMSVDIPRTESQVEAMALEEVFNAFFLDDNGNDNDNENNGDGRGPIQEAFDALPTTSPITVPTTVPKNNNDRNTRNDDDDAANNNNFPDLLVANNSKKKVVSPPEVVLAEEIREHSSSLKMKIEKNAADFREKMNEIAARALSRERKGGRSLSLQEKLDHNATEYQNEMEEIAARALFRDRGEGGRVEGTGGRGDEEYPSGGSTDDSESDVSGTIKVQLRRQGDTITEMYDLTAFSNDDSDGQQQPEEEDEEEEETFFSNDVSSISEAIENEHNDEPPQPPQQHQQQQHSSSTVPLVSSSTHPHHRLISPRQRHFQEVFPEHLRNHNNNNMLLHPPRRNEYNNNNEEDSSSVPVPETDDGYGNLVLDMSDIYEEDGIGSPLVVLSPIQERNYAVNDTSSLEPKTDDDGYDNPVHNMSNNVVVADGIGSPVVLSPIQERNTVNTSSFTNRGGTQSYDQEATTTTTTNSALLFDEESSVPVPEIDDRYGNLVLDISNIFEEDGIGSPLVLSPVQESRNIVTISSSFNTNSRTGGSRSFDPENDNTDIKYNFLLPDEDYHYQRYDDVDEFIAAENYDRRDDEKRIQRLAIADAYRQPSNNRVVGVSGITNQKPDTTRTPIFDQMVENYYGAQQFSPATMPTTTSTSTTTTTTKVNHHHHRHMLPSSTTPHLIPAIRRSTSRDSAETTSVASSTTRLLLHPKVSFSQEIEERIFSQDEYEYNTAMHDVKSSLAAIVHEERDFTEPLPSALSREADEAFRSFTDQLGREEDGNGNGNEDSSSADILLAALSYGEQLPSDFEDTIQRHPDIAMNRLPEVDSFALHVACVRAFRGRFAKEQTCRVKDLIHDLAVHQQLIEALVRVNPETCRRMDENGDLPVHVLARHLMEWEAQWYQKVYDKTQNENEDDEDEEDDPDKGNGITTLYQTMSECINTLLQPISQDDSLCLQSGSMGRLLPLHIAAIFTVSYNTLRSLLEAFPNAASIKCDLNEIRTFVPTDATPLELHDRLSTDFPKWEIQRISPPNPGEEMTQEMLDQVYDTTQGMRRSDLMFAFSPKILPYRKEAYRIRRLEQLIQKEMQEYPDGSGEDFSLTRAAEIFWVWICEFRNQDDTTDHYAGSVRRIIDPLPFHAVRYLASILNEEGYPVIDRAIPPCVDAIVDRMTTISETKIPVPSRSLATLHDSIIVRSAILRQFDEDAANRFSLQGQGFIGPLCRTIFNITETAFPTSFVLLPYKLVKDQEGRLSLESSKSAKVAMEFADYLAQLTSPDSVIRTLEKKITHVLGHDGAAGTVVTRNNNRDSKESQRQRQKYFRKFLTLYKNKPAYFYFIDDYTGVPIVSENNGLYPLVITDAAAVVEKIFPLMLSGMILMRGEKSISILAQVLLNESMKLVLPHWIAAAKDLIGYLFSPCTKVTQSSVQGLLPLREDLLNFVQRGSNDSKVSEISHNNDGLSSEWVVEVSLIKMVVEMHDKKHSYCGLLQQRAGSQILWTQEPDFPYLELKEYRKQIDFKSLKSLKKELRRISDKYDSGREKIEKTTDINSSTKYGSLFEDLKLDKTKTNNDGRRSRSISGQISGISSNSSNSSSNSSNSSRGTGSDSGGGSGGSGSDSGSGSRSESSSEDEMPGMVITTTATKPNAQSTITRSRNKYSRSEAILHEPRNARTIISNYDDSLDDVVKLRVQLDEQEGNLGLLREQIAGLQIAEDQLVKQEDKITNMLGEAINQKDCILNSPTKGGLTKARALLLRICELEDRVLCREVEVGQLKNDVSFFELEASDQTEESQHRLSEENERTHINSSSSSSHQRGVSSGSSRYSQSDDEKTFESREYHYQEEARSNTNDEPINYPNSNYNGVIDADRYRGEDNSTVGNNSTIYSSDISGYSAGMSSHHYRERNYE